MLGTQINKTSLCLSTDCVDAFIHSDMSTDAVDYEAESWSLTVEHKFCKKQDKRAVKRQDVIYGEQMSGLGKKNHPASFTAHMSVANCSG